eukprot:TRINITY_DN1248_c0_g2_i1.p1 TRINITY_DN1248_c0_g2~~TRINITY_DN1248_c0_g2_i1.p1  ORF type:complete len:181 (+),score=24.03 TRINITY_DN1248_c0_g2_i1:68-610(+)
MLAAYSRLLGDHPYKTQVVSACVLWTTGDILSQTIENKPTHDWKRTVRLGLFGLLCAGPIYCCWYSNLDKYTVHLAKKSLNRYIMSKIFADQFLFEPLYLAFFFSTTGLMEGLKFREIEEKVVRQLPPTFMVDCAVWPAIQYLNFRFFPVHYQAVVVSSVCVVWNSFLSYMAHRRPPAVI